MRKVRGKLSFSNVVALLALFIALGGSAYAASQLPKNSVGTKQLKDGAVTTAKIKNGAVTGAKVDATTLGVVPSATNAEHATTADSANTAKSAGHATSADSANNATNANHATTAESANTATNADHATTAESANAAKSADHATSADSANTATNADHATTADSANTANSAGTATTADTASTVDGLLIFPTKRVNAATDLVSSQKIELGSRGPFNFYARCYDEVGVTHAVEYIEVTSGNATFGTEGADSLESLTPNTPENEREINSESSSANEIGDNGTDSDFRAASTDVAITGNIGLAMTKNGSPAHGDGPFLPGDSCIFGGAVFG
jgi:hypothetical protein